jgi:hypothetical protein
MMDIWKLGNKYQNRLFTTTYYIFSEELERNPEIKEDTTLAKE